MAVDMFLKIDGIPGESTDVRHRDEIDVLSFNWGESQPPTASSTGGTATVRVTMQDFHFAMRINKASPKLFLACASAAYIRNAVLTVRRSGANPVEFLKWTLSDVTVASYQTDNNAPAAEPPLDQISLGFAKIEVEYSAMKPDGSLDTPIKVGWDVQANRPV
jgi:type VI secretion system secreted protein Hcp